MIINVSVRKVSKVYQSKMNLNQLYIDWVNQTPKIKLVTEKLIQLLIFSNSKKFIENQMFSIENSIEKAVQIVTYQLVDKRQEIIDVMHECATKLPEKLSIYSTFLGILNIRNPNFSEDVIFTKNNYKISLSKS